MSFQTPQMTKSENMTLKSTPFSTNYFPGNTKLGAFDMNMPTKRVATFASVAPTSTPPVTFQFNNPDHLADLLDTPQYNQQHMHVGLLHHTDAINKISEGIGHLRRDNAQHQDMTHQVFDNHTQALNHLVAKTSSLSAGVLDHKSFIETQHEQMKKNEMIINQQTRLINDLRTQCMEFHEGLVNHTGVLNSQVQNFNKFDTKLSSVDNQFVKHDQKFSSLNQNVENLRNATMMHNNKISTVSDTLNDVHTGMVHHTQVLNKFGTQLNSQSDVVDKLHQSQKILSSRLDKIESSVSLANNTDLNAQINDIKLAINANAELLDGILNEKNVTGTNAMDRMMSHAARN